MITVKRLDPTTPSRLIIKRLDDDYAHALVELFPDRWSYCPVDLWQSAAPFEDSEQVRFIDYKQDNDDDADLRDYEETIAGFLAGTGRV